MPVRLAADRAGEEGEAADDAEHVKDGEAVDQVAVRGLQVQVALVQHKDGQQVA